MPPATDTADAPAASSASAAFRLRPPDWQITYSFRREAARVGGHLLQRHVHRPGHMPGGELLHRPHIQHRHVLATFGREPLDIDLAHLHDITSITRIPRGHDATQ